MCRILPTHKEVSSSPCFIHPGIITVRLIITHYGIQHKGIGQIWNSKGTPYKSESPPWVIYGVWILSILEKVNHILTDPHYITEFLKWWRHGMETLYALLALCEGNPSYSPSYYPHNGPVMQKFDVFFGVRLNKSLNKLSIFQQLRTMPNLRLEPWAKT